MLIKLLVIQEKKNNSGSIQVETAGDLVKILLLTPGFVLSHAFMF